MGREDLLTSPAMDSNFLTHLRFVEEDDASFICRLRSDRNLNRHLSKSSSDVAAQREWISAYKSREAEGQEFYFVIRHGHQDLGVVRMYDFQRESFCWGSWIILPDRPSGVVTYSALMMYEIGFDILGFHKSHFDVRNENQKVVDFHLRSGAMVVRQTDQDIYFEFPKSAWPAFRQASSHQYSQHRAKESSEP